MRITRGYLCGHGKNLNLQTNFKSPFVSFSKMRHLLYILCLYAGTAASQVTPDVVSSVDTSNTDIKEIYEVYKNYLNSRPDSAYVNPYWNDDEKPIVGKLPSDRFFIANGWIGKSITGYKWTVLAIDKYYGNDSIYRIRALANAPAKYAMWNGRLYNPPFITVHYAVMTNKGWKLKNAIGVETRTWKQYNTKYIHYIFPPEFKFNTALANKADSFCTALVDTFKIKDVKPFDYYITTGTEQMGRLYNMEYWEAPTMGYTEFDNRIIVSARATEYHIHEFVHMLLPRSKNTMVEEGIATYFAGTGSASMQKAVSDFSDEIWHNDTLTFSDIYKHRYFHMYDSYPFYVTGAVVCGLVYDERGMAGLKEMIDCPSDSEEDFEKTVLKLLNMDKKTFENKVLGRIKAFRHTRE